VDENPPFLFLCKVGVFFVSRLFFFTFVKKISFYTKKFPVFQPFSTFYLLKYVCKSIHLCYYIIWLILTLGQWLFRRYGARFAP